MGTGAAVAPLFRSREGALSISKVIVEIFTIGRARSLADHRRDYRARPRGRINDRRAEA